jgi:3-hydroxy-9,10-secoandrosta-1,3,5(10)-triene-9,17-dione monooxygenase
MATSSKAKSTAPIGRKELVQRAREMIPALAKRAQHAETLRTLPAESVRELHESGLLRILQPKRFGGFETDLMTFIECTAALAEGCGSTSWVYANLVSHHWMLGMWPDAAQQEIWGENPDAGIASSFAFPAGRGRAVPGGFRITGRWPFTSGVDCSQWVMVGAIVEDMGNGKAGPRVFMVPVRDLEVIDNWYVSGLTATGSKDVKCQELFVPEHRTVDPADWRGGKSPGSDVNPGPLYRIPVLASFGFVLTGTTLGLARAAWRLCAESTQKRLATYTGINVADFPTVQIKVGEAATLIDLSEMALLRDAEGMMGHAIRQEVPDLETKHRYRRNGTYTVKMCVDAVDLIVKATGAKSLFIDNPMQRIFRDIHAASSHINLNWELTAISYGRIALGLPPDNSLV